MDTKAEVACTYASLILVDDGLEVTADRLNTILKAANCNFVEGYLSSLFANALTGVNVKEIISASSSVAVAAAPAAAPAAGGAPAGAAAPVAEKKEEEKEKSESEDDMGFDLFG